MSFRGRGGSGGGGGFRCFKAFYFIFKFCSKKLTIYIIFLLFLKKRGRGGPRGGGGSFRGRGGGGGGFGRREEVSDRSFSSRFIFKAKQKTEIIFVSKRIMDHPKQSLNRA